MKSLVRDVRNKIFYVDAENLVRDATSNTNELPSPAQLSKIAAACQYSETYTLVFAQLHRRLTHLEYKRHVVKSLLVLDYLIRLKPPTKAVQLKLIVDVREHWNDVWRLAKLRTQSSSATIQQIQRVAERLCAFIWAFEQGEVEPPILGEEEKQLYGDNDEEPPKRRKKVVDPTKKKKKKREAESSSSSSSDSDSSDSDEGAEGQQRGGAPSLDLLSPSRIPNFGANGAPRNINVNGPATISHAQQPVASPFGFDFGFWSDPSGLAVPRVAYPPPKSAPAAASAAASDPFAGLGNISSFASNNVNDKQDWTAQWSQVPPVNGMAGPSRGEWTCAACTFHNPADAEKCGMCGTPHNGKLAVQPPAPLSIVSPTTTTPQGPQGWACKFCSFHNQPNATVCLVCEQLRNAVHADMNLNTDGTTGTGHGHSHGKGSDLDEKKQNSSSSLSGVPGPVQRILSPPRTLGKASADKIACSWCQYLNPVTAVRCEICDRDMTASGAAQRMKLQMAQQVQLKELKKAAQDQQAKLSWQCTSCTHINAPGAPQCVRCRFNPSLGLLPGQSAPVAQPMAVPVSAPGPAQQDKSCFSFLTPNASSGQGQSNTAAAFNAAGVGGGLSLNVSGQGQAAPTASQRGRSSSSAAILSPHGSAAGPFGGAAKKDSGLVYEAPSSSAASSSAAAAGKPADRSRGSSFTVPDYVSPYGTSAPSASFVPGTGNNMHTASTSVSGASSSASSPSMPSRHGRTASMSGVPGDHMPESDLLDLLMEQGTDGDPYGGAPGASMPGAAPSAHSSHHREQSMLQQVAAMSIYSEVAREIQQGKWQCTACSYLNFPQDEKCEICAHKKPGPGNPFANATSTGETNEGQKEGVKNPLNPFAPQPAAAAQQQAPNRQSTPPVQQQQQQAQQQGRSGAAAGGSGLIQAYNQRPSPQASGAAQASFAQQSVAQPVAQPLQPQQPKKQSLNPFDVLQPLSAEDAAALRQPRTQQPQARRPSSVNQEQHFGGSDKLRPPMHSAPPVNVPSPSLGGADKEWSCSACTLMNPPNAPICAACERPRGGVVPAVSPAPQGSARAQQQQVAPQQQSKQAQQPQQQVPKSREASPGQSSRRLSGGLPHSGSSSSLSAADPYSSLLAQGLNNSTSPLPIPSVLGGGRSTPTKTASGAGIIGSPASSTVTLAPPTQPQRHRGSASTPNSRQNSGSDAVAMAASPAAAAAGSSMMMSPAASNKKSMAGAGTLPNNFRPSELQNTFASASSATLPSAQPHQADRDSSFNSFDPSFPVADAFSHLHAGTGPKSPPNLQHFSPDPPGKGDHSRNLSFNAMFNANADLLAKKVVGHVPAPGQSLQVQQPVAAASSQNQGQAQRKSPDDDEFELVAAHGLEVVGEGEEARPKRTKEEREARRKEKDEKRARKEARRAARAAAEDALGSPEEQAKRQRMNDLAIQTATAASLAHQQGGGQYQDVSALGQPGAAPAHAPALPTSPRPTLIKGKEPPPPPPPPMPQLSPHTLAAMGHPLPALPPGVHPPAVGSGGGSPPANASAALGSPAADKASSPHLDQAALRQKVIDEIKSTEKLYVDALFDVLGNFMEPMKKDANKLGLNPKQIAMIFSNIQVLAQFHSLFLSDLAKSGNMIVEVFVQLSDFLKMYTQYLNGYEKSIATINSLRANTKFQKFLEQTRDKLKGRGLMTFLIMPVQRIPRYVLLLRELKRYTPPDHQELEQLNYALTKIESIAAHVNESKRHVENMSKLLDIANRIRDPKFVLFKPDRRLLREGMIKRLREDYVLTHSANRAAEPTEMVDQLVFLFNDLLLWTTLTFDITGSVDLNKLTCLKNQIGTMQYTLSLGVKGKPYSAEMCFLCKDEVEHDEWTRFLEAAIHTAQEQASQPGVRMLQRDETRMSLMHARSASVGLSPSPAPMLSSSPPPAGGMRAEHPLDGPSSAQNYAAQSAAQQAQQHHHQNSHELEL